MLLVSGRSSGMLKVTDGRGDPLCLGHALHQKNCATRQKRGPCMPRDWISSQEPRWELPDIHSISCRRGGRPSSQFFLLQHPKGFCRSLENLLLLPGPCYFLGRQGQQQDLYFPAMFWPATLLTQSKEEGSSCDQTLPWNISPPCLWESTPYCPSLSSHARLGEPRTCMLTWMGCLSPLLVWGTPSVS